MAYWSARTKARLSASAFLVVVVFVGLLPTQVPQNVYAQATNTAIHVEDSWKGTYKSYTDGRTSAITFKITAITPNQYGYAIKGLYNVYGSTACQGQEGTLSQLIQYSGYSLIEQDTINRWGKSPIDRYIFCDIPHFAGIQIIESKNSELMGVEGDVGFGLVGEFTLTKDIQTPTYTKMFVYLEGLTSVLSPTDASKGNLPMDSFGEENGIGIFLKKQYPSSLYTMFSYAGSTSNGQPKAYECKNTFDNTTLFNVKTLKIQLRELMQKTPYLDIYLVGHSYGGVLIMALLADMKYNGMISVNGGSIKGVITLDSPLGGLPEGPIGFYYTKIRETYENVNVTPQCTDLHNESNLESVTELTKIFATGKVPYGSNGHFASLMQEGTVTNQAVAQWTASNKIAVATIGNTVDWAYLPRQCILDFPAPDSKFQSTQWITDKSTQMPLFGRFFTAGKPSCSGTNAIGENHNLAMANLPVEVAIQQLITTGNITSLPIPSLSLQ